MYKSRCYKFEYIFLEDPYSTYITISVLCYRNSVQFATKRTAPKKFVIWPKHLIYGCGNILSLQKMCSNSCLIVEFICEMERVV